MSFWTYMQNNSGGRFVYDAHRGISCYVAIEADSAAEADERAELLGIYFNGCRDERDCDCCGDRWYSAYGEGDSVPSLCGEPIDKAKVYRLWMEPNPEGFVHYKNGRFEPFTPKLRKLGR